MLLIIISVIHKEEAKAGEVVFELYLIWIENAKVVQVAKELVG